MMNKQGKLVNCKVIGGIEWTKRVLADGTEQRGFTWNAGSGCEHDCLWTMPDGTTAECYAKSVAEGVAQSAYPLGFRHYTFHEDRLEEPLRVKQPSNIFMDSMADSLGRWVPDAHIEKQLDVCRRANWHTFMLLTKNAPRLLQFDFPPNVWAGASVPPTSINGKTLTLDQQRRMLRVTLEVLAKVKVPVRWVSFEPLSFDVSSSLDFVYEMDGSPIQWAVIGAASNGARTFQPEPRWLRNAITSLRQMGAAIFFKGNLRGNEAASEWLEEFPEVTL